jgi:hypothetical protein
MNAYTLLWLNWHMLPVTYDNSHDYDHRHFMGEVEEIEFPGYEALVDRFQKEVEDLWRAEDEQEH